MARRGWASTNVLVVVAILAGACGRSAPSNDANATIIHVTATPAGCPPKPATVPAGPVEVIATNLDAATVSEIEIRTSNLSHVLGEKENLIEGLSATFTATLGKGHYIVNCPGALQAHWRLVVSSSPHPNGA